MSIATTGRILLFALCAAAVAAAQIGYDGAHTKAALPAQVPSLAVVKAFDLGLHSALASLRWIDTRSELPFLPHGPQYYLNSLKLVNDLDPRFSAPYAFSVLVLPSVRNYPDKLQAALTIGERGVAEADPDWRIPFYMGTTYQLGLKDRANTLKYYDIASRTPGAPDYIRRFSRNYGLRPDSLGTTRDAWEAIYLSTNDAGSRARAAAHIEQLDIIGRLHEAVQTYKRKHGVMPPDLDAVVQDGIITEVPADPLGSFFKLYDNGLVGIAP